MVSYDRRGVSDVQADAVGAGTTTEAHGMMIVTYTGDGLRVLDDFNRQEAGEFLFELLFQLAEQNTTPHELDRRATLQVLVADM